MAKRLFYLLLILDVLLLVAGYFFGPEQWVMKYDLSGQPISIVGKDFAIGFFTFFIAFSNGVLVSVRTLVGSATGLKWLNIPNREFWMRAENQAEALRKSMVLLDCTGVGINSVVVVILAMTFLEVRGVVASILVAAVLLAAVISIPLTYRFFRPTPQK